MDTMMAEKRDFSSLKIVRFSFHQKRKFYSIKKVFYFHVHLHAALNEPQKMIFFIMI
jgi:hypothetical protein